MEFQLLFKSAMVRIKIILLMNIKMLTIVDILKIMNMTNPMLSWLSCDEHE